MSVPPSASQLFRDDQEGLIVGMSWIANGAQIKSDHTHRHVIAFVSHSWAGRGRIIS